MAAIHQGDAFMLPFTLSSGTEDITPAGVDGGEGLEVRRGEKGIPSAPAASC